jgi:hypothetical protein
MLPPDPGLPIASHAFGLALDLELVIEGLDPAEADLPRFKVRLVPPDQIDRGWEPRADPVVTAKGPDGRTAMSIQRHLDDYRVWARGHGLYAVSGDRRLVDCAPQPGVARWRWQRLLIGHVLPLAAILGRLEVLHASAVAIDGRVAAFVGRTCAGKTSLAMHLALIGAEFVCDDVLAVATAPGGGVLAFPGVGVCNLRRSEYARLGALGLPPGSRRLGEDSESVRVALPRSTHTNQLHRIYFLERDPAAAGEIRFERTRDAASAIGATFNLWLRSPERLERQLELAAAMATSVDLFRARVPGSVGAREAAASVLRHLEAA